MITLELVSANVARIAVPAILKADDFSGLAPQLDAFIKQRGTIRLLLDASACDGWDDMTAFERHIAFVKTHHRSLERIAVIAGHRWQHWLAGALRIFVHPEVRIYDKVETTKAMMWITE
jgi:hypothetical protein